MHLGRVWSTNSPEGMTSGAARRVDRDARCRQDQRICSAGGPSLGSVLVVVVREEVALLLSQNPVKKGVRRLVLLEGLSEIALWTQRRPEGLLEAELLDALAHGGGWVLPRTLHAVADFTRASRPPSRSGVGCS